MTLTYSDDERQMAEDAVDNTVNYLNSARDGGATPVKVQRRIKTLRNEIAFLRDNFPDSEYAHLTDVLFGQDVAEHYGLEDLL